MPKARLGHPPARAPSERPAPDPPDDQRQQDRGQAGEEGGLDELETPEPPDGLVEDPSLDGVVVQVGGGIGAALACPALEDGGCEPADMAAVRVDEALVQDH